MRTAFPYLLAAFALGAPSLGFAAPLDCPDAPAVFGEADAGTTMLRDLARTIGSAGQDGQSPASIADDLRAKYPRAGDADIADIMITAYCTWLDTDAPEDQRSESNVSKFEQQVYDAVFEGPPPPEYKTQDWIRGN